MSDSKSTEALRDAWSSLRGQWTDTRASWLDAVANRFEREFWREWEDTLPSAIAALEELEETLSAALAATQRE